MHALLEDMHIHSTFSDGKDTIEDNLLAASAAGLREICLVDHVRADTPWVERFVNAVSRLRQTSEITIHCGLEAKFICPTGHLDVPSNFGLADFVLAADHRLPLGTQLFSPLEVRAAVRQGELDIRIVSEALANCYLGVMGRYENVILAHPFSFLRQAGIDEDILTDSQLRNLALKSVAHDVQWEISERWRCPGPRTLGYLQRAGVRLRTSTDSHRRQTIGKYQWVPQALARRDGVQ